MDNQIISIDKNNEKKIHIVKSENKIIMVDMSIVELEFIGNFEHIEFLNLNYNKIKKISGWEKIKNIETIYIRYNEITNLSKIFENDIDFSTVKELNLSNNYIADMKFLQMFQNIEVVDLSYNQITKIEGINNLKKLVDLYLGNNCINDVNSVINIDALFLENNNIKSFNSDLVNVNHLNVEENYISKMELKKMKNKYKNRYF